MSMTRSRRVTFLVHSAARPQRRSAAAPQRHHCHIQASYRMWTFKERVRSADFMMCDDAEDCIVWLVYHHWVKRSEVSLQRQWQTISVRYWDIMSLTSWSFIYDIKFITSMVILDMSLRQWEVSSVMWQWWHYLECWCLTLWHVTCVYISATGGVTDVMKIALRSPLWDLCL